MFSTSIAWIKDALASDRGTLALRRRRVQVQVSPWKNVASRLLIQSTPLSTCRIRSMLITPDRCALVSSLPMAFE
jgi:hypothetical protein